MSEYIPEDLFVGDPVLTVRWRLRNRALPLKNRHLRAFTQSGVSNGLASWARQHIEWTLAEGTGSHPDGVLVLSVDAEGRAVMESAAYEPLAPLDSRAMFERCAPGRGQAVECEVVWAVRSGRMTAFTDAQKPLSGANSLVCDLARTLGTQVEFAACPPNCNVDELLAGADEVMLVSDEHGVVGASDASGEAAVRFKAYYDRLAALAKPDAFDRANLGIVG